MTAAGHFPFSDDGTVVDLDNEPLKETLDLLKKMTDEDIIPSAAKSENGATWMQAFNAGQIGILPLAASTIAACAVDCGAIAFPAPDGSSTSTFVGGDIVTITADSEHPDQAWDFIQWTAYRRGADRGRRQEREPPRALRSRRKQIHR